MGITINTFGITVSDIQGKVHNLSISSRTSPSETDVNNMINAAASEVAGEAFASGIDVSNLSSDSAEWGILKNATIFKTCADLLVARDRGDMKSAEYYIMQFDRVMKIIRTRPQILNQTENGPNMVSSINRLGNRDNLTYGYSIAGKIVNGGL